LVTTNGAIIIKLKSIIAVFLIITIITALLSGCASDSGGDTNEGFEPPEYVYLTEVMQFPRLPEWLPYIGAIAMSDDMVYFTAWGYGAENSHINVHSLFAMNQNGTRLTELPNHSKRLYTPNVISGYTSINALHTDSNGNLWIVESGGYILRERPADQKTFYIARKLDKNGALLQEIDISSLAEGNELFHVSSFCVDASGNIYVATAEAIHVFDSKGTALFDITTEDYVVHLTRLADGSVAHFSGHHDASTLRKINIQSRGWGDIIWLPAGIHIVFAGSDDYLVFFNHGNNLFGIESETGEVTHILNWINSDITPGGINNLILLPDESVIASIQSRHGVFDTQINEIVRLTKTPYSELPEKTTLTLGTLYTSHILADAVVLFNRESLSHRIHIIDYSSFNLTEDSTSGLTRLIIDIITGKDLDIIDLTGLPFNDFARRGMFVDLYPFLDVDPELSRSGLIEGILNKDEIDGKLYRIIPGFGIRTLIGSSDVLGSEPGWNMDEFLTVLEENPQADTPLGARYSNQYFLLVSLSHNMHEYVDRVSGTVDFNNSSFIELLELANTFPSGYGPYTIVPFISGRQIMMSLTFSDFSSYRFWRALFGRNIVLKGFPSEDRNGHVIVPKTCLAITTRCSDVDGAWEFLRATLKENFQRNNVTTTSFPVSTTVFEEILTQAMDPRSVDAIWHIYPDDLEVNIPVMPLSEDEADMIKTILDSAIIISEDEALWDIINESASDYFNGFISAQDAARIIQSRASTYIAERG
jgi:ABC-type glycerol-3-phosphate transport system substrate-binding protein